MSVNVLSPEQVQKKLLERSYLAQETYYAMYSTWWGGVITDPALMLVPIDDHLVHRGDGVFEAIKVVNGKIFLLEEHLQRLASSAELISLPLPMSLLEMKKIILETIAVTKQTSAILRLYISRGPGGFTTNPYDSIASQMYLIVTALKPISDEKYAHGVSIGRSAIAPKEPWLARIKSCNYLQNVLMKKESVDRKLDFTVSFDAKNILTESSTENIILLDKDNNLVRPKLTQILKGTTMMHAFELAKQLVENKTIAAIQERDLTEEDILTAKEVMMIGTTLDILPVSSFEGKKIGEGKQGPVAKKLLELLRSSSAGYTSTLSG